MKIYFLMCDLKKILEKSLLLFEVMEDQEEINSSFT